MPYLQPTYHSKLYRDFRSIDAAAWRDIIHFFERRETDIRALDFDEYFEDVVGVSIYNNSEVEVVVLKVSKDLFPYIESKPIHGSQRVIKKDVNDVMIELKVKINHELIAMLFSFMDAIEILEPLSLRNQFKQLTINILNKYN